MEDRIRRRPYRDASVRKKRMVDIEARKEKRKEQLEARAKLRNETCFACSSRKDVSIIRVGSTYPLCREHFKKVSEFVLGLTAEELDARVSTTDS